MSLHYIRLEVEAGLLSEPTADAALASFGRWGGFVSVDPLRAEYLVKNYGVETARTMIRMTIQDTLEQMLEKSGFWQRLSLEESGDIDSAEPEPVESAPTSTSQDGGATDGAQADQPDAAVPGRRKPRRRAEADRPRRPRRRAAAGRLDDRAG